MAVKWHPVAAVTASRLLHAQLCVVEQHAGWDFEYTDSIPHARRFAHRRSMIIIGADLVARVRKPLSCGGAVVVATVDLTDRRMFAHAERIGAAYIIGVPQACPWLIDRLLQSHRWCGMPAPHPPGQRQQPIEGEP